MKELKNKLARLFRPARAEQQQGQKRQPTQILGNLLHHLDLSQLATRKSRIHQNPILHGDLPLSSHVVRIRSSDRPTQPVVRSDETHRSHRVSVGRSFNWPKWHRLWKSHSADSKADHYKKVIENREKQHKK